MAPAPRMAKSKSGMTRPLQRFGDVLHETAVLGFGFRWVALQNPAIAADEELLEVPADVAGDAAVLRSEEAVERVAVGAVHLQLRAQREAHLVVGAAEGGDFRLTAGFLRGELVAWEPHHGEVLLLQLALQLLEPGVLRRQAAAAGDIHRERHLALQRSQQVRGAVDPTHCNIVKATHEVRPRQIRVCVYDTPPHGLTSARTPSRSFLMTSELNTAEVTKVVATLNRILELELAGLVRYLHYSFMVFGHNRIPIVAWLRAQADESQAHAVQAGEHITNLAGHPSLKIGPLLETHKHNVEEILREALTHEQEGLAEYRKLLAAVADRNIMLEEYARAQIAAEEAHVADIGKMLRKPGSIS